MTDQSYVIPPDEEVIRDAGYRARINLLNQRHWRAYFAGWDAATRDCAAMDAADAEMEEIEAAARVADRAGWEAPTPPVDAVCGTDASKPLTPDDLARAASELPRPQTAEIARLRAALARIRRECEATHTGQARAYTALSRIDTIAREALK